MARRGATDLSGMLAIDKPAGCTSHDVVTRLREATGEKRIGHAGTLDPMATGLLIVLIGSATRLERYLSAKDKTYKATITFGSLTDTLDAEGEVVETRPVPAGTFDSRYAQRILDSFLGQGTQVPPRYSAIKRDGVAAYRLARAGAAIEMQPREIVVREIVLERTDETTSSWDVSMTVSKGTYVRSLARDIGSAAGTVAHLTSLRRTAVGPLVIGSATSLDAACAKARTEELPELFLDPIPLLSMPVIEADAETVGSGRALPATACPEDASERCAVLAGGRLRAVYRRSEGRLRAETVFVPGVSL